ncbi:MAG: helix-turn-helix transcriptional regulator [Lachnospiraceae bacterium]|nr:helix-turn-helix transcriptional regulator [Lachnospiraceae bacterium]
MSEFTAKKLKEARVRAGFTQDEAAKLMNLKKTTMSEMEAGKRSISADELAQLSRIYEVDVRELLFLEFTEAGEEQRLAAKYSSFFKLLEKLSDRDIEDVYWVIKKRKVEGLL